MGNKGAKETVSGSLVCLLTNYEDGSVQPVVATSSWGEKDQYLHVVHTKDGQVYALQVTEKAIQNTGNSNERDEFELQGQFQG